jgi:hypothetical protein
MPMQRSAARLLAVAALLAFPLAASAQTPAPAPAPGGAPAAALPPFRLGFGDMMVMAVQTRHTKMWMAVQAKNWELADWNRDELDETFRRLGRLYPKVEQMDIAAGLMMVKEPMDSLKKAIDEKNAKDFAASYERLTQACNACHMVYKNPMISIHVPKGTSGQFVDQDFAPPKKSK